MIRVRERRKGERKKSVDPPRFPGSPPGRREAQRCHLAANPPQAGSRLEAEQTLAPRGRARPGPCEMEQKLLFVPPIYRTHTNTRFLLVLIRKLRAKENELALV